TVRVAPADPLLLRRGEYLVEEVALDAEVVARGLHANLLRAERARDPRQDRTPGGALAGDLDLRRRADVAATHAHELREPRGLELAVPFPARLAERAVLRDLVAWRGHAPQ